MHGFGRGGPTPDLDKHIMDGTPERVRQRYARLMSIAEQADFGTLDADVVVIDTETTGVSHKKDELTQIAAARMAHGQIKEWFVTFVNPGQPIPEDIVHLTNITDEDVADAPSPQQALIDRSSCWRWVKEPPVSRWVRIGSNSSYSASISSASSGKRAFWALRISG